VVLYRCDSVLSEASDLNDETYYSGSKAKSHPFTDGMKPTTGNLSTLVGTAGVGYLHNIFK